MTKFRKNNKNRRHGLIESNIKEYFFLIPFLKLWIFDVMKILTVYANDEIAHEYNKETSIDEQKLAFLDKMDGDMDRGIKIQGELIPDPDKKQRATFVAMNLLKALKQGNDAVISASCAYLANRLPALIEVRANDQGNTVVIELVEEH